MKNADRPAYPKTKGEHDCGFTVDDCHGLTKREYFAAMMMQGILANANIVNSLRNEGVSEGDADRQISLTSIRLADELLKKLES